MVIQLRSLEDSDFAPITVFHTLEGFSEQETDEKSVSLYIRDWLSQLLESIRGQI